MTWTFASDYDAMSRLACDFVEPLLVEKPEATLCLATGGSPTGLYGEMVRRGIGSSAMIVKLDEWLDVPMDHPATCEVYLRQYVLGPLSIPEDRYLAFRSDVADPVAECHRVTSQLPPLDLAILGVGRNGHLGLNEPREELSVNAHVSILTEQTRTHGMLADENVTRGLSLGVGQIFSAKRILMLISGTGKDQALAALQSGIVSTQWPVTLLNLHTNVDVLVDHPA